VRNTTAYLFETFQHDPGVAAVDIDLRDSQQRVDGPLPRVEAYLPIHKRLAIGALVTAVSLWIRALEVMPRQSPSLASRARRVKA
jgi:hypothetical protein